MQGRHLFEYAVLRLVPRVEREEFINIGVILFCGPQHFLGIQHLIENKRLNAFCDDLPLDTLHEYLAALEALCKGDPRSDIARMPIKERFRWMTANRSTILQTSAVHLGFTDNAELTLQHLLNQLVKI